MDDMSEPRRLNFTTIGPMGKEKKKKTSMAPTIRFTLALRESNDKTCPEFSYADLMKNALGDCKTADPIDIDFDLEDQNENEKLVALAKSFEERYGPKHKSQKRCDAIQDLIDLGDGYDETDPFVDNSEAYDELVPACLTTKLGGFYINSGVLDFRDVSEDSNDDFLNSPIKRKKKSKRVISSDNESDGEMKKIPKIKKLKDGVNKDKRKKSFGDKDFKKPRKPTNRDLLIRRRNASTVKELLKQQTLSSPTPTTPTTPTASASTSKNGHASDSNGNNNHLLNTAPTNTTVASLLSKDLGKPASSSLAGYIGAVGAASPTSSMTPMSGITQVNDVMIMETALNSCNQSFNNVKEDSNSRDADKPLDPESIPKLSDGIPDPLEKRINQLKRAAEDSVEGKCKFFTSEVNKMLLEIETESRLLNCSQRSSIYAHLAAFLPCSKETLLKRAKKLILTQQDDKLKEPTQRLRDAINEEMPAQLEKYKNEYHGTSLENPKPITDINEMKEEGSTESDDEKGLENDKLEKKCLIIKKKFEWNEKIRSLLCDIVKLKLESYGMSKLRAQSAEEYLKSFLKSEVKPLWPKGWMLVRILFKESRSVHNNMTLYKAKKVPLVNKTPLSISVGNAPNVNTKDPSPHSNNSSTSNVRIDQGLFNPNKTDVTPILTALANEMMESPTTTENKNIWNLLEYPDYKKQQQSQSFGESSSSSNKNSTPLGQLPLYFPHKSPDSATKESSGSAASTPSMYPHSLTSTPNPKSISVLPSLSSSQEISPTMPSVKAGYSQLSPNTTPTSIKQQPLGIASINLGKTSLHSHAQFSGNKTMLSDSELQKQLSHTGSGLAAALLAKLSPQQQVSLSPTGISSDTMSQNYLGSYGLKDSTATSTALTVKSDPKLQHNGQSISPSALKQHSQISPTAYHQNIKQKDSSPSNIQSKQPALSPGQMQATVKIMTKVKKDSSVPPSAVPSPENAGGSLSPGQFSPKDDCKNTYLAEFQRYAASCLKTTLASQKGKMQQPIASTAVGTLATTHVSRGLDVKTSPQSTQSSCQLAHSLTTTSPTQHHVQSPGQQQSQIGLHQSHSQQQKQMTLGISQNIHQSHHSLKSHSSSHQPLQQQHSKQWRPPQQQQQQQSSQQLNRHPSMQQQQPPKSYSSSPHLSMKPLSASALTQVVNYQTSQLQLNVQKQQQSHVKAQQPVPPSPHPRTTISPQQQQQQIKVDSVLKHLSTTSPPVQTVSSLTATRHTHQSPPSIMVTGGVTGIHSQHSASPNLSPSSSSSLKQQTRTHCLESALAASLSTTASTTSASLGSASSGSVYKLPTNTNITSSVVAAGPHQHLSSYSPSSQPTSHTATTLPQQHQQGFMRSPGQAGLLQLRAAIPSKNSGISAGGGGSGGYSAMSTSQGKSSTQTWICGGSSSGSPQSPAISSSPSSCKRTSSPVFSSPPSYQSQHGLPNSQQQNYSTRTTLPGLVLDKMQSSSLSGSIQPSQLNNQEIARHSKNTSKPRFMAVAEEFLKKIK